MQLKKTLTVKVISFTILFATVISLGSQVRKDIQKFGNVLSASSPWIQTDWSGGQNSEVVSGTVSTYLSSSEINTLTANSLSLAQTNGWSNDMLDWSKRKSITLNNTLAEQTNYQVRIPVSYDSDMQPDFDDIRFTNSAGTVLDFWLEHKVDNTSAIVWVEVDTLAGSGNTSIYMYYGNSIATSSSNGLESFILFDDFTADTLDPKWTVGGTNVYTLSNDRLNLGPGSSGWNQSLYATSLLQRGDLSFDMKYKWTSSNASYDAMMLGWKDNTANASYTSLIYAYYNSGTGTCVTNCPVNVYESGTNRSPVTGAWTVNQEYLVRVRMRNSGGAFYEQSTDFGNTWNTSYTSTFSTATNIRPGWALYSGNHEFDDVRVRKWMTTEPTANFNNEESKYQSEGILDSNILDTGVSMDWGLLNYISSGTGNVTVKVRTDNSDDMGGATAWGTCNAITSGTDISANNCVDDGDRYIQYQVKLEPSGASTPVFEEISIAFVPSDQLPPDVNATDVVISGLANSGDWYANEPTITWTGGVDDLNGNGILGHCIAIDEAEPNASNGLNPAMTSGILTGKNDGVAQEYCPYIVVGEELEVSAVIGLDLIAGKQYYISIKAVDIAGNIYTGTDETWKDLLSFKYDNEEPTAPFYISLPANFLSSKDVVVTWPVGVGGADDLHSGLAGLQYRIGDTGTWYGDLHTGTEDINDLLINDGSYVTDETYDYPELVEGNNLIYFRAVDNLGNVTAPENYVKGILKLNTVAPSPVRNLSVNPINGTENNYTFTWDVPGTYTGSSSGIRYCYTVNAIPSVSNCIYTDPGVTTIGPDAYATQPGENTMYVVAKDEAGNINYATYSEPGSSVTYTYSGTAPGMAQNLDVADISVKATLNWRLVLSWDKPTNVGAGISYYNIYRSITNTSCSGGLSGFSKIGSSTSTSYIDPDLEQKNYYYCIKACDSANNCSASSGTIGKLPTGKYTTPAELLSAPEVVSFTTRKAVISWVTDRVSDSSIEYGLESGKYFEAEVANSNQLATHTIPLNNLEPGTTYYFRAKWTDVDGNTGVSEEKTFATLPPPRVSNVTVSNITTNSVVINFKVINSIDASILYGLTEGYGGVKVVSTSLTESTYTTQLTNLTEGSRYNFKFNLRDVDSNTYSYFENHQFSTLPFPRIQDIQIEEVKNTSQPTVDILWKSNVPISSLIRVHPQDNPEQKRDQIDLEPRTDHLLTLTGLQANMKYIMIVSGRDTLGNEAVSEEYQFTTDEDSRPPVISNVKVETRMSDSGTPQNQAQLIISWDTDESATSQIEYGEGSSGEYTQKTLVDDNSSFNHLIIINNLRPSSVYHLRVLSKDSAGNQAVGKNIVTISAQLSENPLDIIISRLTEAFGFIR